ncbi:M56 family metallopeptidase [Pedobacter aquatilis]|uniref:M56 family metallopeptidase n=1 Tax=Pedobacter aquatilis TaxID=351343 RepID=UPI0025B28408|nr:M56 family metallopeptidase [Pedobacter aquatilis]MDN3586742.1 M56 family metallopeptidase [Pedobacter aquatilis]
METLLPQFIKAFGWSILNSLWQSALIYGVLFIVLLSLPKLAAKYKHNLAFGSILLMFGCFIYNLIDILLKNLPISRTINNVQNVNTYAYINNVPENFSTKIEQYFPVVVVFYVMGILLQILVIVKGYNQLARFKKDNLSIVPNDWNDIFQKVTANLKISKTIKFHLSSIVNVPLVIGYLKPMVLFPVALINELDNDQVEAILIHELSHIRRNDFLLNLIKTAIETFLFFNPFVWMAGRFIHIEREHACDDLVLKLTGKPLNYAHALLKLELLKDKNSPAYALAATGKTQNLYQRIKRITNMKTNYLNAKQQMAALTLGVACLFSIAWINPVKKETKKVTKKIETITANHFSTNAVVLNDTTKKRKIRIVTVDANGKRTEYNSVKEMPDSLRKDFYDDELFGGRRAIIYRGDSAFKFKDSLFAAKIHREFSSPEAKLKWKKYGEDIAREFSSPEAQAKWRKMGEQMTKEFSSPEAQAKWKKLSEDLAKEYSSPEAQAKWKKFGEDIAKEYNSPEAQAKWKKMGEDMSAQFSTPEFRAELDALQERVLKYDGKKLTPLSRIKKDSLSRIYRYEFSSPNGGRIIYRDNQPSKSVRESDEYKKLKQKFEKEVKELVEKQEKKESLERRERTEKN